MADTIGMSQDRDTRVTLDVTYELLATARDYEVNKPVQLDQTLDLVTTRDKTDDTSIHTAATGSMKRINDNTMQDPIRLLCFPTALRAGIRCER